jgi:hypothetical protein
MTKLEEIQQEVGLKMGYAMAGILIDAAQDEVWELIEKVLTNRPCSMLGRTEDEAWCVWEEEFWVSSPRAKTAKEAVLAAAKELGIKDA